MVVVEVRTPSNGCRGVADCVLIFRIVLDCVYLQAFTGKVPFHNFVSSTVTWKLMNGDRPPRPYEAREFGLTDPVWRMTECCWVQPPKDRLKASDVVDLLREM